MGERRYELDWLRVMVVLLLIYYHSARVFDNGDFYVKNSTLNKGIDIVVGFGDIWAMPLLFFIAGAAVFFALRKRTGRKFLAERAKRLLVPLVFGVIVIVSLQIFVVYVQKPGNPVSYLAFWKYQLSVAPMTQIVAGTVDGALITGFTWELGHLWFIAYLFVFCIIALPLFLSIRSGRLKGASDRCARFCSRRRWGIFLLALPLMICYSLIPLLNEFLARLLLVVPFIYGFLVYSNPDFGEAIDRNCGRALLAAAVTTTVLGVLFAIGDTELSGAAAIPWMLWVGLEAWLWLMAIIGLGRRYLNFANRALAYAGEGSYPFYILHQTVIVVLALGIIDISTSIALKYLLLTTASLLLTVAIYDLLVRRWRATRFLFGMHPKARAATPAGALEPATEPGLEDEDP